MVGRREIMVGTPSRNNPTVYEQVFRITIAQVAAFEDLPDWTPPEGAVGGY
jgi:hypothetical protein